MVQFFMNHEKLQITVKMQNILLLENYDFWTFQRKKLENIILKLLDDKIINKIFAVLACLIDENWFLT